MIILEGNAQQIETSRRAGTGNGSQSWNRIGQRAAKKGAGKSMLRWLGEKATESAMIAAEVFEKATTSAKPKVESASRTALQAAGDISESVALKLLGMSKAARIAALRNMPHTGVAQLLAELEREGSAQSVQGKKPQSLEIQRIGKR